MKKLNLESKWLVKTLSITLFLVIAYIFLHSFICKYDKSEIVGFSKNQIDFIENIKLDTALDTTQLDSILYYYLSSTGFSNLDKNKRHLPTDLSLAFHELDASKLRFFLTEYRYERPAPFWLTGEMMYLEIIFWSLFGVLASLLYHGTEAIRQQKFDARELSIHWAKLIYTPLITVILIISVDTLIEGGNLNLQGLNHWLIVVSFILGFYSRRSIDLLDRIKEIIFRSSATAEDIKLQSLEGGSFENLSNEEQKTVLHQAKKVLMLEWAETYDGIQSVTTGKKEMNGVATNRNCLIFQVDSKKEESDLSNPIPPYISFDSGNISYELPTDVEEVGQTRDDSYKPGKPKIICTSGYQPGCSVGRGKSTDSFQNTGTLGLKVHKVDDPTTYYLLSCYHVLCSKELQSKQYEVNGNATSDSIYVPGPADGTGYKIAKVQEGYLNSTLDIGIAELIDSNDLSSGVHSIPNAPSGIREVTKNDEKKLIVKMAGRSSNLQLGKVIDSYTFTKIKYDGKQELHTIYGVIEASKISTKGDSGAAVVDKFGSVVGILVSSNSKYSYIIPIEKIKRKLNIEICTD